MVGVMDELDVCTCEAVTDRVCEFDVVCVGVAVDVKPADTDCDGDCESVIPCDDEDDCDGLAVWLIVGA